MRITSPSRHHGVKQRQLRPKLPLELQFHLQHGAFNHSPFTNFVRLQSSLGRVAFSWRWQGEDAHPEMEMVTDKHKAGDEG